MAKSAKQVDDVSTKLVNSVLKRVLEAFEDIEVRRGQFMNAARRHREIIAAEYERAASNGIPQKVMKLQVEIERLELRLKRKIAELESENQKMLRRVLKAHGNKAQLALMLDVPVMKKKQSDIEDIIKEKTNGGMEKDGTEGAGDARAA